MSLKDQPQHDTASPAADTLSEVATLSEVGTFDPARADTLASGGVNTLEESNLDPLVCPLCGEANSCLNQGAADVARSCWCNDPDIHFPESLLSQIPPEKRRKACVCRRCAERHRQASEGGL